MNPETERLIDLATRPLADNAELHLAAAGELRRQIGNNPAPPETLAQAADSLARADSHPRRNYWRAALYLTTLLASLPVLVHSFRQILGISGAYSRTIAWAAPNPAESALTADITPDQRLLLFGNQSATNNSDRWKPLWESAPENPAYFAEYAAAFYRDNEQLSPEIMAAAAKIDPGNGWYPATSAAGIGKSAVTKGSLTAKEVKEGVAPAWKINDPDRLRETLALIHQAAGKPRFTIYHNERLRQCIPLFRQRSDMASLLPPTVYLASQPGTVIHISLLAKVMAAGAQECANNHDITGFRQIIGDWLWLANACTREGDTLIDMLIARVVVTTPLANFRDAARSLGLEDEARRFADLRERMKAEKDARDRRERTGSPANELATRKGSLLASLTIPTLARQVDLPPSLTEADLRPGRYADHAVFARAASIAIWILLGSCAGLAALHRYRQSPLVRFLSLRMLDLLSVADWAWMLLGGTLAPLLWHLAITRLIPELSAREWSIGLSGFIQPSGQFGALAALMMALPVAIASWRLTKRGAALGLATPRPWIGWIATAAAALAIPAFGAVMFKDPAGRTFLIAASALLGTALLWLIVGFSRNVLGRHCHALRRAALARMVLPAWIFGMCLMAAAELLHHAEERHWIQQDHLYEISAECPAPTCYEWQVAQILRKELLEMIARP